MLVFYKPIRYYFLKVILIQEVTLIQESIDQSSYPILFWFEFKKLIYNLNNVKTSDEREPWTV